MIRGLTTSNKKNLFSINRQINEKISSKKKLNFRPNSERNKLSNFFITQTKLPKYTTIYSKCKSNSKSSTKHKTITNSKRNNSSRNRTQFKSSFSLPRFIKNNSCCKFSSIVSNLSNFNNSILHPKTPNNTSRNISKKLQKNSTTEKKIYYPSLQSINNIQSSMHNSVRNLDTSYINYFLKKKKVNITSKSKNKNKNIQNDINKNVKSRKMIKIKKYKIVINDEECLDNKFTNNDINDRVIKSILDLKNIQNKIQDDFQNRKEKIYKKEKDNENMNEFSFNREFFINNYFNENNDIKNSEYNNGDIIDIINEKERCNLIKSKIINAGISGFKFNKGIYDENCECDTPRFTTLDKKKTK